MSQPEELEALLISVNNLASIQDHFNSYQEACFTQRPSEFFALELCGEAGELANLEKKSWKGKEIPAERFADEAADVLIALMNYANAKKIPLAEAVADKLRVIEERRSS